MIYANGNVIQSQFPDGTLHLNIENCVFGKKDYIARGVSNKDVDSVNILWRYNNDAELFTLIALKGYLDDNYPHLPVSLDMPYLPHARMDRTKNKKDVFTLKYFCQVINALSFDKVRTRDCHSNVGVALLDRVENEFPDGDISIAIQASSAEVLFFPDEGAMKRYSSYI